MNVLKNEGACTNLSNAVNQLPDGAAKQMIQSAAITYKYVLMIEP